jgi:uncharacterized protein DUF6899
VPYIEKGVRESLAEGSVPTEPGELSYAMSQLIKGYLAMNGVSYASINSVVGVLECLKLELYRRIAAPYEQKKLEENGDVW